MENTKKKDWLIVVMLVALIFMSACFAVLSQKLEFSNKDLGKKDFGVEITKVLPAATQGLGNNIAVSSNSTIASFAADLHQIGDSVTYAVTVENKGNIDAKLDSIVSDTESEFGDVTYTYDGIASNSILKAGDSITFNVTIHLVDGIKLAESIGANLTTILNYIEH